MLIIAGNGSDGTEAYGNTPEEEGFWAFEEPGGGSGLDPRETWKPGLF